MIEGNKVVDQVAPDAETATQADWEKPELRRLQAREAEGASGTGGDAIVFS